jgi:hypothetical protein
MVVIPVQMGDINVSRVNLLQQIGGNLRIIPPASPIARANQPRINQKPDIEMLDVEASMAEYSDFHRTGSSGAECDALKATGHSDQVRPKWPLGLLLKV